MHHHHRHRHFGPRSNVIVVGRGRGPPPVIVMPGRGPPPTTTVVYPPPPSSNPYPPAGAYPPPPASNPYPPAGAYPPGPSSDITVQNPKIPYLGPLPRLQDGTTILVNGLVPMHADRFHINLQLGSGPNDMVDCALHVNPRFQQSEVIRNALLHNTWGPEEKAGYFPLQRGVPFECIILSTNNDFKIAFNGNHYCEFAHRVGMDQVNHLAIGGDVTVYSIKVTSPSPPMPMPPPPSYAPYPTQPQPLQYNLPVRNTTYISGGFVQGRVVTIQGMPKPGSPSRFRVDLSYFNHVNREIAFHFNPRFPEKTVVRNAMNSGKWGKEEKKGSFPFAPGAPFSLVIICMHNQYQVLVDGVEHSTFQHRLKNLERIEYLLIDGDVLLASVKIQ